MILKLSVRNACWTSFEVDLERLFSNDEVQKLLDQLLVVVPEKVLKKRQVKSFKRSTYKLMTEEAYKQAFEVSLKNARKRMTPFPMLRPYTEDSKILCKEQSLRCHDTAKYAFVDITFGMPDRQRCVVIREQNGDLRTARRDEKDRLIRTYFPRKHQHVVVPPIFNSPYLEEALAGNKHKFVLQWACVQFEPDDPQFVHVCKTTYDDVDKRELWQTLQSTSFFTPMVFYLCMNKRIDQLLLHFFEQKKPEFAATLVRLYYVVHPDTNVQYDKMSSFVVLEHYIKTDCSIRPMAECVFDALKQQSEAKIA